MDDREYELKKEELALREREVAAKENESRVSRWTNPLIIAIAGATLALVGNIVANTLNNRSAAETERLRAQSNLVLEIIKTNGNADTACKNLNFVVNVGLLNDSNGTIHNVCGEKTGVPTLPSSLPRLFEQSPQIGGLAVRVVDKDSHAPIANAKVEVQSPSIIASNPPAAFTDSAGLATLNFVLADDTLNISKEGYDPSAIKPVGQLFSNAVTPVTIELNRTSSKERK